MPYIRLRTSHGRSLQTKVFKQLPAPEDLEKISSEPARQLRQAMLDGQQLTPRVVAQFVKSLLAARGRRGGNWQALQDHSGVLLPYLRATPALAPLLAALRRFGSGALTRTQLDAKLRAAVGKFDPDAFSTWAVKVKAAQGWQGPMTPAIQDRIRASLSIPPPPSGGGAGAVARSAGATPPPPDLKNPVVQLTEFETRLKTFNQDFSFIWTPTLRKEPAINPKKPNPYLNVGLPTFKARRIGIVFHVFLFVDEYGWLYPPQAYRNGTARARKLVDGINRFFRYSGSNIQFYIQEYRAEASKWPYLVIGDLEDYQDCAAAIQGCSCELAADYAVKGEKYVNMFVVGDPYGYTGLNPSEFGVVGATSVIPPLADFCNTARDRKGQLTFAYSPTATPKRQHLWLPFTVLDPFRFNRDDRSNTGANIVAHELGHLLGLLHTHQDAQGAGFTCSTTNDGLADTPIDKNAGSQPWLEDARSWCISLARYKSTGSAVMKASMKNLTKFDSCPQYKYIDNVFNIMSYSTISCQYYFTRDQIRRMQNVLSRSQARLGA